MNNHPVEKPAWWDDEEERRIRLEVQYRYGLMKNYTSEHIEEHDGVRLHGNTFLVEDEGYSLGSALRFLLNKNPHVSFCGYSIMHPTEKLINIRIQTSGEITPNEALREACQNLKHICSRMTEQFLQEMSDLPSN